MKNKGNGIQAYIQQYHRGSFEDIEEPLCSYENKISNYWIVKEDDKGKNGLLRLNEFPAKNIESALKFAVFMHKQDAQKLVNLYSEPMPFKDFKEDVRSSKSRNKSMESIIKRYEVKVRVTAGKHNDKMAIRDMINID